ncbi:glycosyltransferase [Microbacterium sp.]|uniref:glycosyltransferase n=1 Tax=Microbacterium sp. TaxID=51671 RepID=UPI003242283F
MTGLLVHEWVERSGGAERVLDIFAEMFPDAPVFALWDDDPERYFGRVSESWMAKTLLRRHKAAAVPLLPRLWRSVHAEARPDWLLVSSHLFAHHVRLQNYPDVPKLVYAHTPARYIWEPSLDRRGNSPIAKAGAAVLKPIDRRRAQEAHAIAVNSKFTQDRVRRSWEREATVIYPPVDVTRITSAGDWRERLSDEDLAALTSLPNQFVLGASRFVPYKRLHLVIECAEANGVPAVIAGGGPQRQYLLERARSASVPVHIVDRPSDPLLYALYQASLAFVFPGIEDFGIMPVEAMATGTPVIVPAVGGAAESITMMEGGSIFEDESVQSWRNALEKAVGIEATALSKRVSYFDIPSFRARIESWMHMTLSEPLDRKELASSVI